MILVFLQNHQKYTDSIIIIQVLLNISSLKVNHKMIEFFNVESCRKVRVKHQGNVNQKFIFKCIQQLRKQLAFFGRIEDAQISHDDNGLFKFITSGWSTKIDSEHVLLKVNVLSSQYLRQHQNILNRFEMLKQKYEQINSRLQVMISDLKKSNSVLKVDLLWSNPFVIEQNGGQINVINKDCKYEKLFGSMMKIFQQSSKEIQLSVSEFNKCNFIASLSKKSNIIFINAHSQQDEGDSKIYAESRSGYLQKFSFEDLYMDSNNIDLIILRSTSTMKFGQKLLKFAKNLILIQSNVYHMDPEVQQFTEILVRELLKGELIKSCFQTALTKIKQKNNIDKINQSSLQKNKLQLIKRNSENFDKYPSIENFYTQLPSSPHNNPNLNNKFQISSGVDLSLKIEEGVCVSDLSRKYMYQLKFELTSSQKKNFARCLYLICIRTQQYNERTLLIHFFERSYSKRIVDHLFQLLVRKKFIEPKKYQVLEQDNKTECKSQIIQKNSFIIFRNQIQNLEQKMSICDPNKITILILISKKFCLPNENKYIKFDEQQLLTQINMQKQVSSSTQLQNTSGYNFQQFSRVSAQLMEENNIYQLSVMFAHFGPISKSAYQFLIKCYYDHYKPNHQHDVSLPHQNNIFQIVDDKYRIKECYTQFLKRHQKHHKIKHQEYQSTIQKLSCQFLSEVLLKQILKYIENKQQKITSKLFDVTTSNKFSILSLYLQNYKMISINQILKNQNQPILNLQEITSYIEFMSNLKLKTLPKDFQLLVCLVLSQKIVQNRIVDFNEINKIQSILQFKNSKLKLILSQIFIQINLEIIQNTIFSLPKQVQENKKKIEEQLEYLSKFICHQHSTKLQKYIEQFDLLMAYVSLYSQGWNQITDQNHHHKVVRQAFQQCIKRRQLAFSQYNKNIDYDKIKQVHNLKLYLAKMLVHDVKFQKFFQNNCQVPAKITKSKYKKLSKYLTLLEKRNRIKSLPSEIYYDTLWRWMNQLKQQQMQVDEPIKQFFMRQLVTALTDYTQKVCYILRSFPLHGKPSQTIIVDFNLKNKIQKLGIFVKQLPLNQETIRLVFRTKCKFLIIWFQKQLVYDDRNMQIQVQTQQSCCFIENFKRIAQQTISQLNFPIQNLILCYANICGSEQIKSSINSLSDVQNKVANLFFYDQKDTEANQEKESYNTHIKLSMNVFAYNQITKIFLKSQNKIKYTTGIVHQKTNQIYEHNNQIQISEQQQKSQKESIQITQSLYKVYKGNMQKVLKILKQIDFMELRIPILNHKIINLKGTQQNIQQFLNFFQAVCRMKMTFFIEGIHRINCSQLFNMEPLQFIEEKLAFSMCNLQNSNSLLILENFHIITENYFQRKTYQYLLELLTDSQTYINVITSSSTYEVNTKFTDIDQRFLSFQI